MDLGPFSMVNAILLSFVVLAVKFTSTWPAGREVLKLFTVMVAGAEAGLAFIIHMARWFNRFIFNI